MDEFKFSSLKELYNKVLPALRCRSVELKRKGHTYIYEEDIWNYLKETKWIDSNNLTLSDMVSDIMNSNENDIIHYMKKIQENSRRNIITDEDKLL